jgi:HEAT repeat protein
MKRSEAKSRDLKLWIVVASFLLAPGLARPSAARGTSAEQVLSWQEQDNHNRDQDARDREQERRDREQEKRDREQEARDREQEKRDREQERADRLEELYDDGREALDEDRYEKAAEKFAELAKMNGPQTDAALYWKAYAENRLGKRDVVLATIADFKKRFAQSRWLKDMSALEIEVQQSTGHAPNPEKQDSEDLKMLALQALINNNPEKGIPMVEGILNGPGSPRFKAKALFLLAQNGSAQSREILGRIAKGQSNPDLQRKAVEYLGLFGGAQSHQVLAEVYSSTSDVSVKRAILRSYMLGADKEHLLTAAKGEKDPSLRADAIRQLGLVHAPEELQQLYRVEASPEIRKDILQAFFLSGDGKALAEAAQGDKDPDVRRAAIHNLGLVGSEEAREALQAIYSKSTDRDAKEEVLNALFIQGNAHALVAIARSEKDPELKRLAVSKLSLMNSKEGNDYLMELLQK